MRIFTIDIGNTRAKGSVFEGANLIESRVTDSSDPDALMDFAASRGVEGAIFCCVGKNMEGFAARLRSWLDVPVMELTHDTPLPIGIEYGSPKTLGVDRIASAAGAFKKYAGNELVVDAGTAVTCDVVEGNTFRGGNISPGMRLRFESLHRFTSRLPLVDQNGELPEFGYDTETAIRSGVVGGLLLEIEMEYEKSKKKYQDIQMIMTGGDSDFMAGHLRQRGIHVVTDHTLVGLGLVEIYKYNHNRHE